MNVTFVTALVLPKDGVPHRPVSEYLRWFQPLAESGIPLIVFVDERLEIELPPSVRRVPTSMTGKWIETDQLPETRNPQKDTASYMSIQLRKLDWVVEASALASTPGLAWIDLGVFHMVRNPSSFQARLRALAMRTFNPTDRILAPGCWTPGSYPIWSAICWRFCGSFLLGPRETFRRAAERQAELVRAHLPRLTWEVNYWTLMEDLFAWYASDHTDLLLDVPG
jgi:hypothetical protein